MICRITGILEHVDDRAAIVAPPGSGLAYEVLLPRFLAQRLASKVGESITLMTHQYLEGQGQGSSFVPRLIGFSSAHERDFFELFTTVKGIGNRKALRAMSVDPAGIAGAIAAKNARKLTELPEIGKRMAETIIAELTGKVELFLGAEMDEALEAGSAVAGAPRDAVADDAIAALTVLGETRADAERMVARAIERASRDGRTFASADALVDFMFAGRTH